MRETSSTYKTLRAASGSYYEVRVLRGETEYGMDKLKSCKITSGLFTNTGPQIGGTVSAQCTVSLLESSTNWPRMAGFEVQVRLVSGDGLTQSEWLSMGKFYTDERSADKYGNLTIVGFDAMLLLEQSWTDKVQDLPSDWPITAKAAAELIAEASGIELDENSTLDDTFPFVGLDTTSTCRSVCATIAAALGGNWQITPEGKLLLVPMVSGSATVDANTETISVMSFEDSTALPAVSGVELTTQAGVVSSAGLDTGYVMKAACDFSDSDVAYELCLPNLSGFQYYPFTAGGALLDPAYLPGDVIAYGGVSYQIITIEWSLGAFITADISAPLEAEVDHEYTVLTEAGRALQKALSADSDMETRINSYIRQTADSIETGVSETYATKEEIATITNGSITLQIPYKLSAGVAHFRAVVYAGGEESTLDYADWRFRWYTYTEANQAPQFAGTGKTFSVSVSSMHYGGTVICRFWLADYDSIETLTDENDDELTVNGEDVLEAHNPDDYLEVQSAVYQPNYTENKFSTLQQTVDGFSTVVEESISDALADYSTTTQMQSAIQQSASEIQATVSTKADLSSAISSQTIHYLATSASSGVTTETSGWTTTVQSITATNKYLWTYLTYTYADNTTRNTDPVISGVYGHEGTDGVGISEVVPLYYASASSTAPNAPSAVVTSTSTSAGVWTKAIPDISSTYQYLYTCNQVAYDDGTYDWTTVVLNEAITNLSTRLSAAELKITDSAIISTVTNSSTYQNALNGKQAIADTAAANLIIYPYYEPLDNGSYSEGGSCVYRGITYTVATDGAITVNGTNSTSYSSYFRISSFYYGLVTLNPGTYTLSGCPSGGGAASYCLECYKLITSGSATVMVRDTGGGVTFTLADTTTVYFQIVVSSGVTVSNQVFRPQLEYGSVAHAWQPTYNSSASMFKQTADEISLKVDTDGVIGAINLSSESATIDASKVNLNGYVTITNLTDSSDTTITTIDGGKIATGSITAGKIAAGSITANKLAIGDYTNLITVNELIGAETGVAATDSTLGGSTVYDGYILKEIVSVPGMKLCDWTPINFSAGDYFEYDFYAKSSASGYASFRIYYANSQTPSSYVIGSATNMYFSTANSDTHFTGNIQISIIPYDPADYDYYCVVFSRNSYRLYMRDAVLRKKLNGELIVDGTVTTNKMKLYGDIAVYNSSADTDATGFVGYGSGKTASSTTSGIHIYCKNSSGTVVSEVICTNAGARVTFDDGTNVSSVYCSANEARITHSNGTTTNYVACSNAVYLSGTGVYFNGTQKW